MRRVFFPIGREGRILIVDDEDILVELNRQRLSGLGYDVTATTSSLDALQMFGRAQDSFDLVITDETMPHMTGMDLAAELLKAKPGIPIILCGSQRQGLTRNVHGRQESKSSS